MPDYSQLPSGLAAYFAGQNQTNGIIDNQYKRQQLAQQMMIEQQKAEQEAQMNPLKLEHQRLANTGTDLANQTTSAQLPGVSAQSKKHVLDLDTATRTQQSNIDTTLSNNENTQGDNKEKSVERARKVLLDAGAQLEGVPAPFRAAAFRQLMEEGGVKPDHPLTQQFLEAAQKDPKGFPKIISNYAERLGAQAEAMSPAARSAKAVAGIQANAHIQGANIAADASRYATDKSFEAKQATLNSKNKAKDILEQVKSGALSTDKAMAASIANYQLSSTEGDQQFWKGMVEMLSNAAANKAQGKDDGTLGISVDEQGNVRLTPRTRTPIIPGQGPAKPKGTGTAADPIKLD